MVIYIVANINQCMSRYYENEDQLSGEYVSLLQIESAIRKDLEDIKSGRAKESLYFDTLVKIGSALTQCYIVATSKYTDEGEKKDVTRVRKEIESMKGELEQLCTCTCKLDNKTKDYTVEPKVIKKKFGDKLYYAIDRRH